MTLAPASDLHPTDAGALAARADASRRSYADLVPARVLVVEDDEVLGSTLVSALAATGYATSWARGVREASSVLDSPRLILLDLGLPDGDGFSLCRELRLSHPDARIVVLTARRDPLDVVAGLESGADDYLFKPFSLVELLARVRAHLRTTNDQACIRFGPLLIDRDARIAAVDGMELALPRREFDLLTRLTESAGRAVSRATLIADVWDEEWSGSTKTLDVHIAALRRRFEGAGAGDRIRIRTLRGHGYALDKLTPGHGSESR